MHRAASLVVMLMLILILALQPGRAATAAPAAELWPRWQAHDETSALTVDHSAWADFLSAYVVPAEDGINRVRYGQVTLGDRARLEGYIETLEAVDIDRLQRAEQMAFWINLYNAATVRLVLEHYPISSIRDIGRALGLVPGNPWGNKVVEVAGERLTLDDIEHRILRPIWGDNRVHYAVNCAALGCPNLARLPYRGATIGAALDAAARRYVNHPRGVEFRADGLHVSAIYVWYQEDFGGSEKGVIAHLKRYAAPELASRLQGVERIAGGHYDWSLNDAGARDVE